MKSKKSLIALVSIFGILFIGLTIAYFTNTIDIENIFKTKQYGTTFYEEFVSPDNWIPGTTIDKMVYAENTGEIDEAVRISYTEVWTNSNGEELSGLIDSNGNEVTNMENSEHAAILNLVNDEYWIKDGDYYYYYKYKLNPGDLTGSFLESVTFNKNVKSEYNCDSHMNSETQLYLDCDSTKTGYNNAKYKLTFKVETVQYNKYKEAWNTDVEILEPFNIKGLPVNPPVITMNEQTKKIYLHFIMKQRNKHQLLQIIDT